MSTFVPMTLALCALLPTAAPSAAWTEPTRVLALPWGASIDAVRQAFPDGQFGEDTAFTSAYHTTTTLDKVPFRVAFQFVSDRGLQGVMLRFPLNRLTEVVALFERQYGRAPIRGNAQWEWKGTSVRISLGDYPRVGPPGRNSGRQGIAWLRTNVLEDAIAHGAPPGEPKSPPALPANWRSSYEERILRRIYWALRYPDTTQGIYLVSLVFQLTAAGRTNELHLTVDPPNADVAESIRAAVSRAQPFPLPPSGMRGIQGRPITLTLTVTILR
jgi:hypothetical protein